MFCLIYVVILCDAVTIYIVSTFLKYVNDLENMDTLVIVNAFNL
jgi:hypothetical protein